MFGLGSRAGETDRVDETFAPLRRFRRALIARQTLEQARAELDRVDHLSLRRAGVDAQALDADAHLRRGERLVVDPADLGAVERVGEVRTERVEVEVVDA